jgi:hypothetical protein
MYITLNVTVGNDVWDSSAVRKEVEVKTENPTPELPWETLCAGLIQAALKEYKEQAKEQEAET